MRGTTNAKSRRDLFDLYAANLMTLRQDPRFRLVPDIDDVFLCPICYQVFTRDVLNNPDVLTVDHIKARAVGGTDATRTLACKQCNNLTGGSKLESQLKKMLRFEDVIHGVPGSSCDIMYSPRIDSDQPRYWLPATLAVDAEGVRDIVGDPSRTAPEAMNWALGTLSDSVDRTPPSAIMGFDIRATSLRPRRALVALLRIAYLYAFSFFGYAAIVREPMKQVRNQIREPDEQILKGSWAVAAPFRDEVLGMNIVTKPESLRAYLVVYEVDTGLRRRRWGVFLPCPDDTGLEIYSTLAEIGPKGRPQMGEVTNLLFNASRLTDPRLVFDAYQCWSRVVNS